MIGSGRTALALAASLSISAAAVAETTDFRARGNEPGWSILKTDKEITFRTMDGKTVTISPVPDGSEVYQSTVENGPFSLTITGKLCVDTMSGMAYPSSVTVEVGGERYSGCGGEPARLLHGEWAVEQIDGKPVVQASQASLSFGVDGQLSGNASCNRYFGPFALTGEGLTISDIGSSRMMCEQPLMDQEALFLNILGKIGRFEIGADGSLILRADDGRSVIARRKG